MGWLRRHLKRGKTDIEGDTLDIDGLDYIDAKNAKLVAKSLELTTPLVIEGDVTFSKVTTTGETKSNTLVATAGITGATVSDADGLIQNRRYIYQSPEITLNGAAATLVGPIMPVGAQIQAAYYVVTEAIEAGVTTMAVQIGSTGDNDAHVLGTTDLANGLIVAGTAIGTVVPLTLGGADAGAIAAPKNLTVSHIQHAAKTGKVIVIVEYNLV